MTWSSAVSDLRVQLSDGPADKLRYRKRCLDQPDGVNTKFKTFEFRRLTDFTSPTGTEGVYVNGALVTATGDAKDVGEFTLPTAPADGAIVEATYYVQWFTDAELQVFLSMASMWLGLGSDPSVVQVGLQPAAIKYAIADAYQKLALRWAEHLSETFRFEDAKDDKRMEVVTSYRNASKDSRKEATELRDHFYTRQGQSLQPLFANISGSVSDPTPKR